MDHETVVRQKVTERYLLNELDSQGRDEFEEHFFDCQECALDVGSGAVFIEQSKVELAKGYQSADVPLPVSVPAQAGSGWRSWFQTTVFRTTVFRPAILIPVLAMLLVVIGYQNLVTLPTMQAALHRPQVLPWTSVNVGTYGSEEPVIKANPGEDFVLFVRIPPDDAYSQYTAELYNPTGKVEWKVAIPASATQDQWPLHIPAAKEGGSYSLAVRGVTHAGESKEIGRASFELQIEK